MKESEQLYIGMKKLLTIGLFTLVASLGFSQGNETSIIHEGHYQGKNLYVQNPFAGSGVGFCVIKVTVNGDVTTDQINSSAFEIDFTNLNLKVGDPVSVKIFHKLDCLPKVLNPEVLKPKSTFETTNINVSDDKVLHWTTTGEQGKLTYIVEQYRWNKWIKVGEVEGDGTAGEHSYEFKIAPHSGENKFRVKQVDYTGRPRISPSAKYTDPSIPPVEILSLRSKNLEFSAETLFEIIDIYGNLVKKGFGKEINVENLKKGLYYVNFDNQTGVEWNKK